VFSFAELTDASDESTTKCNRKGQSRLYGWAGDDKTPKPLKHASLKGLNPEAVVAYRDKGLQQVQLLSDDSKKAQSDSAGKTESVLREKQFRSIWVLP